MLKLCVGRNTQLQPPRISSCHASFASWNLQSTPPPRWPLTACRFTCVDFAAVARRVSCEVTILSWTWCSTKRLILRAPTRRWEWWSSEETAWYSSRSSTRSASSLRTRTRTAVGVELLYHKASLPCWPRACVCWCQAQSGISARPLFTWGMVPKISPLDGIIAGNALDWCIGRSTVSRLRYLLIMG